MNLSQPPQKPSSDPSTSTGPAAAPRGRVFCPALAAVLQRCRRGLVHHRRPQRADAVPWCVRVADVRCGSRSSSLCLISVLGWVEVYREHGFDRLRGCWHKCMLIILLQNVNVCFGRPLAVVHLPLLGASIGRP